LKNSKDRRRERLESIDLAREIVYTIADKKGSDIIILDIRSISFLADYFVICSGETERQIKAIVDGIAEKAKKELKVTPLHIEGKPHSGWVLMDYGSVIVHVFSNPIRDYYRLEELWSDATTVVRMI
jgi:ribosome-associated protein